MKTLITPGVCWICGDGGYAWADPSRTVCIRCVNGDSALIMAAGLRRMAALIRAGAQGPVELAEEKERDV